jgi:hypothetical protein
MSDKWPTLEGRLNQPLTSELDALEQLQKNVPLSEYGKTRLKKLTEELKSARINQPKVTLKEAQEQAKRVMNSARRGKQERSSKCEIK